MREATATNQKCRLYKKGELFDAAALCDIELTRRSPGGWVEASKSLIEGGKESIVIGREYTLVLEKSLGGRRVFKIRIVNVEEDRKSGAFDIIL